jgi:hypothetical protein
MIPNSIGAGQSTAQQLNGPGEISAPTFEHSTCAYKFLFVGVSQKVA